MPCNAEPCQTCGRHTSERMIACELCSCQFHPSCLGLGKHNYIAGVFQCASCICLMAALPRQSSEALQSSAHRLVWLKAQSTQASSQATYASGLARFTHWATNVAGITALDALPSRPGEGILPLRVELFISWAATKYAGSTIDATINALAHWHKSKGLDPSAYVRTAPVKELLKTVKAQQGPTGIPTGKVGLSRDLLRLLLGYLSALANQDTGMAAIYLRDQAWLALGYFGMLRRSEIIALTMGDLQVMTSGRGPLHIELRIPRSKTDRIGQGATITIAATSKDNIPILSIVQRWYNQRTHAGARPQDPLFTAWDLDSVSPSQAPLKNGQALAKRLTHYLLALKSKYPALAVNPSDYGMHSLRRGGVLAAWLAGVDIEKIKSHGRWRSDAVRAYMQANLEIRMVVTTSM